MRKYLMIKSNIKQRLECLDINKLEKLIWKRGRFMKDGEFAIYLGKEYSAGETQEGKIVLRSTDIEDVKNGFEPCKPFNIKYIQDKIVCFKYVNSSEITEYYIIRTMAIYKGFEFEVVEETEDKLSIVTMIGDYRDWIRLGMKSIDIGVYQKWINKNEAEIKIVKENYKLNK